MSAIKRVQWNSLRPDADGRPADQVPVFIVGLHRSGTSLVERILGASPDAHNLGETERLSAALRYGADMHTESVPDIALLTRTGQIDFLRVRKVFEEVARAQSGGKRFVTEKSPANFLNIGFIQQALPHARILHMRRDPIDIRFANYREHFAAQVTHTHALDDLIDYHGLYEDLMRYWRACSSGFVLDVDYERLVSDPETEARRIFTFVGVEWRADAVAIERRTADPVATLSSVQVRRPVNTASIGRWRAYAPWLAKLIDAFPDATATD